METNPIEEKIIQDFCEAWNMLAPDLIIQHLSTDFEYDSQWTMETLDYKAYVDYIKGKFETLQHSAHKPEVIVVEDTICKFPYMLQISQGGNKVFYRIKVKDNKVYKGDLCMF